MPSPDEETPIIGSMLSTTRRSVSMVILVAACLASFLVGILTVLSASYIQSGAGAQSGPASPGPAAHEYAAKIWKRGNVSFYDMSFDPNDDFSYGSSRWGNPTCRSVGLQSPIDMGDASNWGIAADLVPLKFDYRQRPLKITNNGKTIFFDLRDGDDTVKTSTGTYGLAEVRFHMPSEHSFNGARYPMEIQFFHNNKAKTLPADNKHGVVSVFAKVGKVNGAFPKSAYKFKQYLPMVTGVQHTLDKPFDLMDLLPGNHNSAQAKYLSYSGSLTTPPCSENVKYFVYTQPIEFSQDQLDVFSSAIKLLPAADSNGFNARPVQSRGARAVLVSTTAQSSKH
mmetsp:Transcript_18973/g.46591  ORF Transcript_18973/g.46591 Transcript_18973/m.46591 type:complete len:339 (-) Transcript_18973:254-1270(-)